MPTPRITKLKIKNFGCIGTEGIEIDIDKIVVLVGANNAGKSTILRAFEVVADCLKLEQDDFHNRQVTTENHPEIELHSIADESSKPGDQWCHSIDEETWLVKERWTWTGIGTEPKRIGFNATENRWANSTDTDKMPWGANNVAKARRPKPHRVNTFDEPEIQCIAITSLMKSILEDDIKRLKVNEEDESTRYESILKNLSELKSDSKAIQDVGIADIQTQANVILERIFPNHALTVVPTNCSSDISIDLLGDEFSVEMGPVGGTSLPLRKQGSGTRRTALWTVLKLLADKGFKAKPGAKSAKSFHEPVGPNTAHILLIDEPEVSLHPRAIQSARDVLYSLPQNDNWQVMITTHSPSFIDLTKDHTTIIRVDKTTNNNIQATTLYRPDIARLDPEDKNNLKLINLFDSHISEAFFGGRILVVEGDTEYTAFNYIKQCELEAGNDLYNDLNIIRARGKVTVASMMKVLNHFKNRYFVIHDTDRATVESKVKDRQRSTNEHTVYRKITITNPAWTNNEKIRDQMTDNSRVIASAVNFEEAYFYEVVDKDKPENCINQLKSSEDSYNKIKQLLDGILELNGTELPEGSAPWANIEDLATLVAEHDSRISIEE